MAHHTKDKGDLAVAKTIAHLLAHDIRVCTPLSEHLPFDLIAVMPDMVTLKRVQVKYRAMKYGAVEFPFRANYFNSKRIYSVAVDLTHLDSYALFCPDNEQVYYLRSDEVPEGALSISMRVNPSKNGQTKNIWWAQNFVNPLRMEIQPINTAALTRRGVSEQDEIAVAAVMADLSMRGLQPCPALSQYLPFDLIAVHADMKTLQRVRVGYGTVDRCAYGDIHAVYDTHTKSVGYFDAELQPFEMQFVSAMLEA
jgi:hypothetical protein